MARVLTNNKNYYDIADTIRQMKNVDTTYKPREMASALKDIYLNEVEGVPPLSFESNGMPLIDYRIDGASGGVGDLITDSSDEKLGKYKVPVICGGKTTNVYLDKPIEAKANIPNEYTEVEYIKNTGPQYIDAGIIPSSNWKYEIIYKDNAAQGSNYVMGSRQTTSSPIFAGVGGGQSTQSVSVHNSSCTTPSNYRRVNYIYKIKAEYNSSGTGTSEIICLTNNEKFTGTQTANIDATANCYIFSINTSQTHEGMSLYKLKLWKNNVLVRNFIPCYRKSDNVAGLYDLVNSTFYTNQGTGNFIVGPVKENESISLSDTEIDIPTIDGANTLTIDTTVQPTNVHVQARKNPDFIALDMSNIRLATSTFTTLPSLIANADWSQVTNVAGMFNYCTSLTTVPELDLSSATNLTQMFRYCTALTNLGGFKNLGQAYLTSKSSNYSEYKLDLSSCTQLTHDSLMNVINNLYDIATKGCNTQQLILGSTNLAKLTAEEISTAVNKGWSLS